MRILVLGGYGLIGLAIARTLQDAGHCVTAVGRARTVGPRLAPRIRWVDADIASVLSPSHSLREIVERLRSWMGVPPATATILVPSWAVRIVAKVADLLGYLGWRSPLRTTAVRALEAEVLGDPEPLREIREAGLQSLDQLLDEIPASTQERWFARAYLLLPVMVAALSAFWIASGIIGVLDVDRAARTIPTDALPPSRAAQLVVSGAALDVALGIAVLFRPLARLACLGMVAASLLYIVAGSVLTPGLWLDPLGPLVEIVPAMVLAAVTAALLEER